VHNQPVEGIEAIREFYRNFIGGIAKSPLLWHFTHEEKESATATVGMVFRTLDGNVMTALGTEVAHFDTDGRITRLTATS
jgi:hypothetical protein